MQTYYMQFIIVCWIIFFIYWTVSAFFVKRTVERQSWFLRLLPFILVVIFFEILGIFPYMQTAWWPQTMLVGIVSDAVAFGGLALMIWARKTLGANWTGYVAFKENHELIETGPYAYVRHPIYTGLLLLGLGTAILCGQPIWFAAVLMLLVAFWLRVVAEEKIMTKHFPKEYPAYKEKTKIFIPFIF